MKQYIEIYRPYLMPVSFFIKACKLNIYLMLFLYYVSKFISMFSDRCFTSTVTVLRNKTAVQYFAKQLCQRYSLSLYAIMLD